MTIAIILAGGDVRQKFQTVQPAARSPAIIPVHTRPLAAYVLDVYRRAGIPSHLFVSADSADQVAAELGTTDSWFTIHPMPPTGGVVESLHHALQKCASDGDVIVNVVTTVPDRCPEADEVFLAESLEPQPRLWSGVLLEEHDVRFSCKSSPLAQPTYPFTGVFRARRDELVEAVRATHEATDLLAVVQHLHAGRPRIFCTTRWIDCGHEINYHEARATLMVSRALNRVQVDTGVGVLTKRSADHTKLQQEARFVQMLPEQLAIYFPRILQVRRLESTSAEVAMEYYGYPTLAEYQLYWDLGELHWTRVFQRLVAVLGHFRRHAYSIGLEAYRRFYLDRIDDRIARFHETLPGTEWAALSNSAGIKVNGVRCRSYADLHDLVRKQISDLYREGDFCVMHGDFCFNNILYDRASGIVRLIDPRGAFGADCVGIYGDAKYDVAKLIHSAAYGYDYLASNLFMVTGAGDDVSLRFNYRDNQPLLESLAWNAVASVGMQRREIDVIVGLIFLAMCPLHEDSFPRQVAMYAHGLRILNQGLS